VPSRLPKPITCLAVLFATAPLVPSAAAAAPPTHASPSYSAVQEFLETLPDGAGDRFTGDIANALPAPPRSGLLSPGARRAFGELGPQGAAAAALAEASATGAERRPAARATPEGKAPFTAALERLGGGSGPGGMGLALPTAMVLSVLAALGYGLRRR
jgi:hypothetical protein